MLELEKDSVQGKDTEVKDSVSNTLPEIIGHGQ